MSQLATLEPKDPNDAVDYRVDWSSWLRDGEVIVTSSWLSPVPAGLTIDSETNTNTAAIVWVSGGIAGQSYSLTNRITTNNVPSRQRDKTIIITVKEL